MIKINNRLTGFVWVSAGDVVVVDDDVVVVDVVVDAGV